VAARRRHRISPQFGNVALAFSTQRLPTRLFTDEQAALTWLRKFIPLRR
jgi:hypothetical protein